MRRSPNFCSSAHIHKWSSGLKLATLVWAESQLAYDLRQDAALSGPRTLGKETAEAGLASLQCVSQVLSLLVSLGRLPLCPFPSPLCSCRQAFPSVPEDLLGP